MNSNAALLRPKKTQMILSWDLKRTSTTLLGLKQTQTTIQTSKRTPQIQMHMFSVEDKKLRRKTVELQKYPGQVVELPKTSYQKPKHNPTNLPLIYITCKIES